MGKGNKKKFIAKGEGQHFYLLHRSQTDTAHLGDAPPSNFVLVAAEDRVETRNSGRPSQIEVTSKLKANKDHINALGFKNDGYDYSQHLREMGGGHFIGVDGKMREHLPSAKIVELPEDALPSGEEFNRQLEAITIGEEFMDEDLADALFGEGEEFEELDDDFVGQAMTQPAADDFDYDAHIANLIARSEGQLAPGGQKPRGWSEDDGEEEEDNDGSDVSSYDEGEYSTQGRSGDKPEEGEYRQLIEEQFEKTLEGYQSDDIGDLEDEAYDEEMQGNIELDGDNEMFTSALEEFLQESKDHALVEGVTSYVKNSHAIGWVPGADDDKPIPSVDDAEVVRRMQEFSIESTAPVPEQSEDAEDIQRDLDEMMTSQAYLREERPQEQWDCETILSTYSTLDNHPALIKNDVKPKKKKKNRSRGQYDGEIDDSSTVAGSELSRARSSASMSNGRGNRGDVFFSKGSLKSTPVQQIVLGGKYMLPKKDLMGAGGGGTSGIAGGGAGAQWNPDRGNGKGKATSAPILEESEESEESSEEESGSDVDSTCGAEGEGGKTLKRSKKKPLRKRETPEEKRLRKAQVKEERKTKRVAKKQLKTAFRSEEARQGEVTSQRQDTDHVSVFRY